MATSASQSVKKKSPPRFRLRYAFKSDVGKVRSENQDSYGYVRTKHGSLFVVADGMGGMGGGSTASTMAVNILTRTAVGKNGLINEQTLKVGITRTHDAIQAVSRSEEALAKMGTTIVALALADGQVIVAHVGDSRLYLCHAGKIQQLTRDHTLVQELVDSGTISRSDAENHPMAHFLTRSISPESAARAEVHCYPHSVEPGDKFLLCCDGLYNLVSDEEVLRIVQESEPEQAATTLVNLANELGGTDNITVELVEVETILKPDDPDYEADDEVEFILSTDYRDAEFLGETAIGVIEQTINEHAETVLGDTDSNEQEQVQGLGEVTTGNDAGSVAAKPGGSSSTDESDGSVDHEELAEGDAAKGPQLQEIAEEGAEQIDLAAIARSRRRFNKILVSTVAVVLVAIAVPTLVLLRRGANVLTNSARAPGSAPTEASVALPLVVDGTGSDQATEGVDGLEQSGTAPVSTAAVVDNRQPASQPGGETPGPVEAPAVDPPGSAENAPDLPTELPIAQQVAALSPTVSATVQSDGSLSSDTDAVVDHEPGSVEGVTQRGLPITAPRGVVPVGLEGTGLEDSEDAEVRALARVMAEASRLSVPPAPSVALATENETPDQPINWGEEELRKKEAEVLTRLTAAAARASREPAKLIDDEEKKALGEQKQKLRDRIAEIDAKMRLYRFTSKDDAEREIVSLKGQLKQVDSALELASKNLDTAKRRYQIWSDRKKTVEESGKDSILKLAGEVSTGSILVKRKKEVYEMASLRYSDAVELWTENPGDNSAATKMAQYGRELKSRRANLEQTIVNAIDESLQEALNDIADWGATHGDLLRRNERLSRQVGFAKAFTTPSNDSKSRIDAQRKLFDDRTVVTAELEQLRAKLSDNDEVEFKRVAALKAHTNSPK